MKIWKRVLGVTLSLVMSFELMPLALSEREQTAEDRLKEERAYSVLQKVEGTPTEQYEGYRFTEYCFEKGAPELVSFQWTLAGVAVFRTACLLDSGTFGCLLLVSE